MRNARSRAVSGRLCSKSWAQAASRGARSVEAQAATLQLHCRRSSTTQIWRRCDRGRQRGLLRPRRRPRPPGLGALPKCWGGAAARTSHAATRPADNLSTPQTGACWPTGPSPPPPCSLQRRRHPSLARRRRARRASGLRLTTLFQMCCQSLEVRGVSDWGGPEHNEPLAYAIGEWQCGTQLAHNLVCGLIRRCRPSTTDTVPIVHAKCARHISNESM